LTRCREGKLKAEKKEKAKIRAEEKRNGIVRVKEKFIRPDLDCF
jgi:hypothetical protein